MDIILWLIRLVTLAALNIGIVWLFYRVVMKFKAWRELGLLNPVTSAIGYTIMYIGLILDIEANIIVASVVFMELPRELTISARVKRLVRGEDGWRRSLAIWVARVLLNPYSGSKPHVYIP